MAFRVEKRIMASIAAPATPNIVSSICSASPMLADVHRDDTVGAHGAHDVGGHVVHRAAVHEQPSVDLHWRKDKRERHRCPHRLRKRAAIQHDLIGAHEIDGDGAERGRQIVEALDSVIWCGDAREQQVDLPAVVQRRWEARARV